MTKDVHMSSDEVGEAIQQAREAKGMTLRELADEADLEFSYIAKIERGEIGAPGAGKLQRLATALDIDIEDLYGLAGYLSPKGVPDLPAYLRTKYDLPARAAERVDNYLTRLKREYDREAES